MANNQTITWSAPEYEHKDRGADWYIALGVIAISASVASFLLGNMLFGIFILIGMFTLAMYGMKKPDIIDVEINRRGISANNKVYPFRTLDSFWIEEYAKEPKIIVQSEKLLMPYIIIPLGNTDSEEIRDFLIEYLEEEEHAEPLSHKLMDYLGF